MFNFTGLAKSNTDYYFPAKFPTQNDDIYINMCHGILEPNCGNGVAGCAIWDYNCKGDLCGSNIIGTTKEISWALDGEDTILATFYGGTGGRSLQIALKCQSGTGQGTPVYLGTEDNVYKFSWKSEFACSTGTKSKSLNGGWIFLIFVVCAFTVYFLLGIIIKKTVYHASGSDLLPNRDFWVGLPSLITDGFKFLFRGCRKERVQHF
eukprot:TRINITY_DN6346_c0_g2_i1.p1 TRINITY_DN6346_c0_g2~~TRINITY_DN6346_c0_g2_i1.p1  ORF type:complete len:207 (+),score=43.86 TRINITY_DN6346_c0_g2_i1:252-872(+)